MVIFVISVIVVCCILLRDGVNDISCKARQYISSNMTEEWDRLFVGNELYKQYKFDINSDVPESMKNKTEDEYNNEFKLMLDDFEKSKNVQKLIELKMIPSPEYFVGMSGSFFDFFMAKYGKVPSDNVRITLWGYRKYENYRGTRYTYNKCYSASLDNICNLLVIQWIQNKLIPHGSGNIVYCGKSEWKWKDRDVIESDYKCRESLRVKENEPYLYYTIDEYLDYFIDEWINNYESKYKYIIWKTNSLGMSESYGGNHDETEEIS